MIHMEYTHNHGISRVEQMMRTQVEIVLGQRFGPGDQASLKDVGIHRFEVGLRSTVPQLSFQAQVLVTEDGLEIDYCPHLPEVGRHQIDERVIRASIIDALGVFGFRPK